MAKKAPPDLLTLTQAATLLGTTRQAVFDATKRERLPVATRYGKLILISRVALLAYKKGKRNRGGGPRPKSKRFRQ